jgi:hypothetical protein
LLASCPDGKYRDGRRAVELAAEAYRGAGPVEPFFAAVLAAALAEAGDFRRAAEWQEKALRLMPESAEKEGHRSRLRLYQGQKPYRQEPGRSPATPAA